MITQCYRVNMYPKTCPSEVSPMGTYLSEYEAEQAIEKMKNDYSDNMEFVIEPDYMG